MDQDKTIEQTQASNNNSDAPAKEACACGNDGCTCQEKSEDKVEEEKK